ncbi:MAG: DUF493 domain-containing protein [Woeseiaceae bacterium]|jgi:hypothetical protein|nr:DUF493 domain-containing protein [Woeseiaceae bacterium]
MVEEPLIEFPCKFPIKMMGRDTPNFRIAAKNLIESHVGPITDDAIEVNLSSNANFVSVTITIIAKSQQQLDDIYRDASGHDDVLIAL